MLLLIFADQVFIDPTFFGIFVCGPLQSFLVNVCNSVFAKSVGRLQLKGALILKETFRGGSRGRGQRVHTPSPPPPEMAAAF